jgi:hypothetical protein
LADPAVFGEGLEGHYLLPHIMGHNLCMDVFGAHSEAETAAPSPGAIGAPPNHGMHGEAGICTWCAAATALGQAAAAGAVARVAWAQGSHPNTGV